MTRTWLSTEQTLPIHVYIIIQIYQSCNSFQIFNLTLPIYLLTASPWLLQPPHNGSCHSQPCHDKIRHELTYSCQLVCNEILEHPSYWVCHRKQMNQIHVMSQTKRPWYESASSWKPQISQMNQSLRIFHQTGISLNSVLKKQSDSSENLWASNMMYFCYITIFWLCILQFV